MARFSQYLEQIGVDDAIRMRTLGYILGFGVRVVRQTDSYDANLIIL